jgi:hypothetical protein
MCLISKLFQWLVPKLTFLHHLPLLHAVTVCPSSRGFDLHGLSPGKRGAVLYIFLECGIIKESGKISNPWSRKHGLNPHAVRVYGFVSTAAAGWHVMYRRKGGRHLPALVPVSEVRDPPAARSDTNFENKWALGRVLENSRRPLGAQYRPHSGRAATSPLGPITDMAPSVLATRSIAFREATSRWAIFDRKRSWLRPANSLNAARTLSL